jgi:hypothetical protein
MTLSYQISLKVEVKSSTSMTILAVIMNSIIISDDFVVSDAKEEGEKN